MIASLNREDTPQNWFVAGRASSLELVVKESWSAQRIREFGSTRVSTERGYRDI